jgi:hypothetical protein
MEGIGSAVVTVLTLAGIVYVATTIWLHRG